MTNYFFDQPPKDPATVIKALAVAIQTPGPKIDGAETLGVPVLLWGPPGVAKTARVNAIARALGYHLETVLASIREPSDFLGLPIVDHSTSPPRVVNAAPDWALRLADTGALNPTHPREKAQNAALHEAVRQAGADWTPAIALQQHPRGAAGRLPGLLFLDEFSTATGSVQSALLRVVHERVVGDLQLPHSTAVIAAANPPDQATGDAEPLKPPTANRFIHISWPPPNPVQWGQWLTGAVDSGVQVGRLNRKDFDRNFAQVTAWAVGFVNATGDVGGKSIGNVLFNMPDVDDLDAAQGPWPSPRSWEIGLRAYAAARAVGEKDAADLLICGALGMEVCTAWNAWIAEASFPAIEDVLTGKYVWRPTPSDAAQTLAIGVALARYVVANPNGVLAGKHVRELAYRRIVDAYANGGEIDTLMFGLGILVKHDQATSTPIPAFAMDLVRRLPRY